MTLPEPPEASLVFESTSEAETDRLAQALAKGLAAGDVAAFEGTLGAGKTRFVRGLAAALHADRSSVSSPTFGLVQHYDGELPLVHIDAYRLTGTEEFERMGGAELFDPEGVTLIEWSERIPGSLPRERWTIEAKHAGENSREYTIRSTHRDAARRIGTLRASLTT
ncbi:tRNA threonylcarbamoyladenosine biosynthesis protein TsaE [Caulifigura coniformis]|uniref:tRNA threonylcarbamoyladenosine biosynthesis protein TsaE n=1 Tax=Caulifigura coniformis TaxID=2527983 RepID=A0A517SH35_9PLAN|nr:tRNA (adenosine(37)-N6)-threonylcarbamoyltransferase complex ATPase subunit type 1 TsaE [Caulifigura coniformis]QDT55431.1 tRNA threonylcarbamoyladenosine biosynthesis protein TsaE [Caulifigura coniformis]